MKMSKVLAAMSAASILASVAIPTFAADTYDWAKITIAESGKPVDADEGYDLTLDALSFGLNEADAAKINKITVEMSNEAFFNGAIGGNVKADNKKGYKWATGKFEYTDEQTGSKTVTWDNIGGMVVGENDDGDTTLDIHVQLWWMNAIGSATDGWTATTVTVGDVKLYDAEGNVLATIANTDATKTDVWSNVTGEWVNTHPDAPVAPDSSATEDSSSIVEDSSSSTPDSSVPDSSSTPDSSSSAPDSSSTPAPVTTPAPAPVTTTTTTLATTVTTAAPAATTTAGKGGTAATTDSKNPSTGASAAFAVTGIALAGAAVVVSKKKK